jgi:hypothetical protein
VIDKLERMYECVRACKVSVHFVGFAELLRTLGDTSPKNICISFFHIRTVHLDIIKVFFLLTDAQVSCLKNTFEIYIKINIKTAQSTSERTSTHTNRDLLIYAATSPPNYPHTDVT